MKNKESNETPIFKLDDKLVKDIVEQAVKCLEDAPINIVKYKKFTKTTDEKADFELESKIRTTTGDCVYALYGTDINGKFTVLKYIGSTKKLTYRLNKHLLKNDDAFLDGAYEQKPQPYYSKISDVYKELVDKKEKHIAYKYFKVENDNMYTAIEALLIEYHNLTEVGWNKRN